MIAGSTGAHTLAAQTDYYNTSVGRPLRTEDAVPVEYRGIELDVAPLRVELFRGGTRYWSIHPETTIGIFPRTQLQIGVPVAYIDALTTSTRGVAGLDISALHALNVETTTIPALAVSADVSLPVGSLGGGATYGTFKAILTRTRSWARFHANAQVSAGPDVPADVEGTAVAAHGRDASRWLAGVAVDKTFPLHSILLTAESFAEQPVRDGAPVAWSAGTGLRYQLSPRWAMDAGVGHRFTGDSRAWFVTFGSAYAIGLR